MCVLEHLPDDKIISCHRSYLKGQRVEIWRLVGAEQATEQKKIRGIARQPNRKHNPYIPSFSLLSHVHSSLSKYMQTKVLFQRGLCTTGPYKEKD